MIERTHPKLSVGAQCRLLSISRSSFYYAPLGETAMNREYPKLCVSDLAHAVFRYVQASKRPANIMAS